MVEILSACPTNWNMTPAQSTVWLREKMMAVFRLGIFKDTT
jgi:2-oxoglutarate ferredoxin oxidoreductase subunit beta